MASTRLHLLSSMSRALTRSSSSHQTMVHRVGRAYSSSSSPAVDTIETVGVVGLGSMGHGVAQLCAESGYKVVVSDHSEEAMNKGLNAIHKSLKFLAGKKVSKGLIDEAEAATSVDETFSRISGGELTHVTDNADIIIEAIIEDLKIKLPFFETLGATAKPDAILATNTSSYSVMEMAKASKVPERVCGLHYFNPVQVMKLVEVVKTDETHPAVIDTVNQFVDKTGKTSVQCGDTPGFIVNRLLVPYLAQGVALLARGDASATDIDTAMRLGAGHPMGPITLADYVGNDVNLAILQGWLEKYPDDPSFQVPEAYALFEKMVNEGRLGRKTGRGFYRWDGNKCLGE